jgi:outer membrane protein OmpA-like peptidoglycan-associated protein
MRAGSLAAAVCAPLLLLGPVYAQSAPAPAADCLRLNGATLGCSAFAADNAPPNTEREAPSVPASGVLSIERVTHLTEAVATLPPSAPTFTIKLLDSGAAANFASGSDALSATAKERLANLVATLRGQQVQRIRVSAHTDAVRLIRTARKRFGTNQRLSEARALAVVQYLEQALDLPEARFAIEARGDAEPIADNDTAAGRAMNRRAEIAVWIEQAEAPLPPPSPAPPIETVTQERHDACLGNAANQLPPVRISVDGVPLDSREGMSEADRQRCADLALARSDLQVRYDPLEQQPTLNVIAIPQRAAAGVPVRFTTYSNYVRYIDHAELRVFSQEQSTQQKPLAVIAVPIGGTAEWVTPAFSIKSLRVTTALEKPRYLNYVLRVYDRSGRFDETRPRRLDLGAQPMGSSPDAAQQVQQVERAAYGENTLVLHNIPVHGGAVTVSGRNVPTGHQVSVFGLPVPLDDEQRFVTRQILPAGPQQVSIQILNAAGEGLVFTRNLSIATDDAFFVAMADLTAGNRSTSGPIDLVTGDPNAAEKNFVSGQLAFYYKGLVKGQWLLTAAADPQDQPLKNLFSNFASKNPEQLLQRIDPNRYYPVYGDDSTTVQDAPTSGKFFIRLEKGDTSILWGDFQTQLSGTEFIQYARTLYGVDLRYRSPETTSYGEKQRTLDAFWAEPGTLESRQEFLGTGGSLYYLQNQDLSVGSEQVWVQVRDRDSGIVVSQTALVPTQDYDINYMEGRILLHAPLATTADSATIVRTGGLDGDPQYLVVSYEYVPDFTNPNSIAVGGHVSQWFGDHLQLGLSSFHQGDPGEEQDLRGIDGTWRYAAGTYIKSEYAHSDGPGSTSLSSITGGLTFDPIASNGSGASAEKLEAALDLSEVTATMSGRANVYYQDRDANFSGPGQITPGVGVHQEGGALSMPLNATTQAVGKIDNLNSATTTVLSGELAVDHKLDDHWHVQVGARTDERENATPNASPILSQNGARTDVAVTLGYQSAAVPGHPGDPAPVDPSAATAPGTAPASGANGGSGAAHSGWDAYGFVQQTAYRTDTRSDNDRIGLGGGDQITSLLHVGAEASEGSLGFGGKLSTDYHIDDRSNLYLNYSLAADQPDALNTGREGMLTSGTRYRYNDATSVYGEERMQTGTGDNSLSHAYGIDFAPSKQWTYGLKFENGTVSDPVAGDQSVTSVAASVNYTDKLLKYGGALEWRANDSSLLGGSHTTLTRNSLTYQVDPDWRVLAKLNWSQTQGASGSALNAEYHEIVVGAAWRPVNNDRWNTLFKFTILNDEPSSAQVSAAGTAVDYAQQSRVVDLDADYQLNNWLSLGGKYALRTGELRVDQTSGAWYASQAQLLIVRADVMVLHQWDGMLELRQLAIHESGDQRNGALIGCYRHFGQNLKIGVGYNFTDYSDNLTDVSYKSHGFFLNTVGKF